jgi:putative DNA primase/helicase
MTTIVRPADISALVNGHFHTPEEVYRETVAEKAERALLGETAHDDGNANCVLLRYDERFANNKSFGCMYYTGTHWIQDSEEAELIKAVTETLYARARAANTSNNPEQYKHILSRCVGNADKIRGAIYSLLSKVKTPTECFDQGEHLLNCKNGIVDLRTSDLLPHTPRHYFTYCTGTDYKPDADQGVWKDWLTASVGPEMAEWLQLAVGYGITGNTREEVLFYLYGPPRSGKGTFTETLLTLLGSPLAEAVSFDILTAPRDVDTQNFRLAPLHSSRLVVASESNQYERFNEAKLKVVTGGDSIQCAFKHRDPFNYRPQFKIWLSSNQPVNADPDDDATWGRLRVVHFPHSHLGQENKALKEQMRSPAVLEGVLAWAVEGARWWYALGNDGLPELESGATLKRQQRAELDNVSAWVDECCTRRESAFSAGSSLYSNYAEWCKRSGVTPKMQRGLTETLQHKGYRYDRQRIDSKQVRGFWGIVTL